MAFVVHRGVTIGGEFFPPGSVLEALPSGAGWLVELGAVKEVETAEPKPAKKKGGK